MHLENNFSYSREVSPNRPREGFYYDIYGRKIDYKDRLNDQ